MTTILFAEGLVVTGLSAIGMVVTFMAMLLVLVLDLPGSAKLRKLFFSFVHTVSNADKFPTTSECAAASKSASEATACVPEHENGGGRAPRSEDRRLGVKLHDKEGMQMVSEDTDSPQVDGNLQDASVVRAESDLPPQVSTASLEDTHLAPVEASTAPGAEVISRPALTPQMWLDSSSSNVDNDCSDHGLLDDTKALIDRSGEVRAPSEGGDFVSGNALDDNRLPVAAAPDRAPVLSDEAPPMPHRLLTTVRAFGLPRHVQDVEEPADDATVSDRFQQIFNSTDIGHNSRSQMTQPMKKEDAKPYGRKQMIQVAKEATRAAKFGNGNLQMEQELTTLSITGLPTRMTSEMLRRHFDSIGLRNVYDYLYMPQDLVAGTHTGRAYINYASQKCAEVAQSLLVNSGLPSNCTFSLMEESMKVRQEASQDDELFCGLWSPDDVSDAFDQGGYHASYRIPQPILPSRQNQRNGHEVAQQNLAMQYEQFQLGWPQEDPEGAEKFSPQIREQFHKTKACKFFKNNRCALGAACTYAHSQEELTSVPDLTKTRLCYSYYRGNCSNANCKYAHGYQELRSTNNVYKTELCRWFNVGGCKAGNSCRYAHTFRELRACENEMDLTNAQLQQLSAQQGREVQRYDQRYEETNDDDEEDEFALFEQLLGKDLLLACGTEDSFNEMVLQ